jgi:Arc/MetJ-type ribon-helix-helix transcriptional regulator
MTKEYVTSEEHLPDDLGTEVTFQVTDRATKEIFTTRARVSADPEDLVDPDRLTVVRGPHENIEEEWYIEILEADVESEGVDRDALLERVRRAREQSNIVNTRADDVMAMLDYLVDRGQYESVSDAARHMLREHLRDTHPDLVEAYIEARTAVERDDLASELGSEER